MKTLFKKTLSALLAVLCFGGMFAAAADAPAAEGEFRPFQTSEEYDDTGKNILPADNTQPSQPGSVTNEYVVVIPANSTVALSEWAPAIKKGTFIAVKAMDTTPSGRKSDVFAPVLRRRRFYLRPCRRADKTNRGHDGW